MRRSSPNPIAKRREKEGAEEHPSEARSANESSIKIRSTHYIEVVSPVVEVILMSLHRSHDEIVLTSNLSIAG
jgi:hypothetical protein